MGLKLTSDKNDAELLECHCENENLYSIYFEKLSLDALKAVVDHFNKTIAVLSRV